MTEGEEKPEEYEVEVIDRVVITTYPRLRQPALTSLVTYVTPGLPPDHISILLSEVAPKKEPELAKQIEAREGPLWEKYYEVEKKRVREKIEKRLAVKPEVYKV